MTHRIFGFPFSSISPELGITLFRKLSKSLLYSLADTQWIKELVPTLTTREKVDSFLDSFIDEDEIPSCNEQDFTEYESQELDDKLKRIQRLELWIDQIGPLSKAEILAYAREYEIEFHEYERFLPGYQPKRTFRNPNEIFNLLSADIVGQEEAKKFIALAIYNHFLGQDCGFSKGLELPKHNILLSGPSGTGKTLIAQKCAEILNLPFIKIDAASLVKSGIIGNSLTDYFRTEYEKVKDAAPFHRAIVFIDEFDKLAFKYAYDCMRIQTELLSIVGEKGQVSFEVDRNQPKVKVSAEEMLFIFSGAFHDLLVKRDTPIPSRTIGFSHLKQEKPESERQLSRKAIIRYGFMPEIINRIQRIIVLNHLTKEDMLDILNLSSSSELGKYQNYVHIHGNNIVFTDDFKDTLAEVAFESKMNGRAIKNLLAELLTDIMIECPEEEGKEYIIDKNIFSSKSY